MQYVLFIANRVLPEALCIRVEEACDLRMEYAGQDIGDWEDEPERMAEIRSLGGHHVYVVHYKDVSCLRAGLQELANSAQCLIDDDFDLFVDGPGFISLCREHPITNDWWLRFRER
jgi:hypothetical protein